MLEGSALQLKLRGGKLSALPSLEVDRNSLSNSFLDSNRKLLSTCRESSVLLLTVLGILVGSLLRMARGKESCACFATDCCIGV